MSFFKSVVNVLKRLVDGLQIRHKEVGTITVHRDPNTNRLDVGVNSDGFEPSAVFIRYLDGLSHPQQALLFSRLLRLILRILPPTYKIALQAFQEYGLGRYTPGEFLAAMGRFKEVAETNKEPIPGNGLLASLFNSFDDDPQKAILQLVERLAILYVSLYLGGQIPTKQDFYEQLIEAILFDKLDQFETL